MISIKNQPTTSRPFTRSQAKKLQTDIQAMVVRAIQEDEVKTDVRTIAMLVRETTKGVQNQPRA